MLNFEDERTSAQQPMRQHMQEGSPAQFGVDPSPRQAEANTDQRMRRVRVEDKRVINGGADVNQLVPF